MKPLAVLLVDERSAFGSPNGGLPAGIFTHQANTLEDGLAILGQVAFDAVVLNLNLPDNEILAPLEKIQAHLAQAAIVVLMDQDDSALSLAALQDGAQDCLARGEITAAALARGIRHAIARARGARSPQSAWQEHGPLAAAIKSTAAGVVVSNPHLPDNPISFVNPAFSAITGYQPEEVVGRNCRFLQGPETCPSAMSQMREALKTRRPYHDTLLNYRKDGAPFWNELTINPVFDEAGRLTHFVGIQIDVTERKQAEVAAARLAAIVESSEDAIIGKALDGTIFSWNQAAAVLYGYSGAEAIGQPITLLTPPERISEEQDILARIARGEEVHNYETVRLRKDGRSIHVSLTISPVKDEAGNIVAASAISRDITGRKEAEEALRASEMRYQRIAANMPGVVYQTVLHPDGSRDIPFISEGCREIFGVEPDQIQNDPSLASKAIHPDDRQEYQNLVAASAATLQPLHWEGRFRSANGEEKWVQAASRPERQPNGDIIWEGVLMDITERKRAAELEHARDEAERANHAKSEFLSRMSHELRTPLNAILGFGQLLESSELAQPEQESVGYILNAGKHLLRLIDEVLDLSRIETGRMEMSPEPVPVHLLMHEVLNIIRPLAAKRRIELLAPPLASNADDHELHVAADRQRLKQVLLNLVSNAVKYNVEGGRVLLNCTRTNGSNWLRLRVADTGKGIPPILRERLFTPFDRLGAEFSAVEGTGLGLALSKRLVEAMGGILGVEDPPAAEAGSGTVFWVELPLSISPLEQAAERGAFATDPSMNKELLPAGRSLLYIEDNLSNLKLIERLLASYPQVHLMTAMQGEQGVALAQERRPDVILLDVHLPDLPGWEVLARLRGCRVTANIPVIVISADATTPQIKRMLEAGAYAYLTKPIDVQRLLRVMRQALTINHAASHN